MGPIHFRVMSRLLGYQGIAMILEQLLHIVDGQVRRERGGEERRGEGRGGEGRGREGREGGREGRGGERGSGGGN